MRARVLALFAALVLPLVMSTAAPAGAGGGGHGLCNVLSKGSEIAMRDLCFQGAAHVMAAGSPITVTNEGQISHDIVSVDPMFRSKTLLPGGRFQFTVDQPGVYEYYCSFHGTAGGAGMAGVLVVEENASLAAARTDDGTLAPAAATQTSAAARQPGSAWGWVALGALLLAGAALCVSLAVIRPRQT